MKNLNFKPLTLNTWYKIVFISSSHSYLWTEEYLRLTIWVTPCTSVDIQVMVSMLLRVWINKQVLTQQTLSSSVVLVLHFLSRWRRAGLGHCQDYLAISEFSITLKATVMFSTSDHYRVFTKLARWDDYSLGITDATQNKLFSSRSHLSVKFRTL